MFLEKSKNISLTGWLMYRGFCRIAMKNDEFCDELTP